MIKINLLAIMGNDKYLTYIIPSEQKGTKEDNNFYFKFDDVKNMIAEGIKQALKAAAENATTILETYFDDDERPWSHRVVDKQSILNLENFIVYE